MYTTTDIIEDHVTHMFVDYDYESGRGIQIFSKYIELVKFKDGVDLKKEFANTVMQFLKYDPIIRLDDDSNENYKRRNISWLLAAGNEVATHGRIGSGRNIIISPSNFKKYFGEDVDILDNFEITFIEDFPDVVVYRNNEADQPGIILVQNDEKYSFVSLGFYPEHQFIKIAV